SAAVVLLRFLLFSLLRNGLLRGRSRYDGCSSLFHLFRLFTLLCCFLRECARRRDGGSTGQTEFRVAGIVCLTLRAEIRLHWRSLLCLTCRRLERKNPDVV